MAVPTIPLINLLPFIPPIGDTAYPAKFVSSITLTNTYFNTTVQPVLQEVVNARDATDIGGICYASLDARLDALALGGITPGTICITDLDNCTASASQVILINDAGDAVIGGGDILGLEDYATFKRDPDYPATPNAYRWDKVLTGHLLKAYLEPWVNSTVAAADPLAFDINLLPNITSNFATTIERDIEINFINFAASLKNDGSESFTLLHIIQQDVVGGHAVTYNAATNIVFSEQVLNAGLDISAANSSHLFSYIIHNNAGVINVTGNIIGTNFNSGLNPVP